MVIGQHIGRLGNNMFQISAAIAYAKKFNYKWGVDPARGLSDPYSAIHQVFPNLPKSDMVVTRKYHEHQNNAYCDIHRTSLDYCHYDYHTFIDRGGNITLFGFWQSYKYFEDVQEEVKKVFALDYYQEYSGFTSIHVRRGDYVQHSASFPPVTVDYIEKAIQKIRTGKYLVFSDDIEWCKVHLNHLNNSHQQFEFFTDMDERRSLSAMASCGNHIIANSSFSWWAGYLGFNPDRVVVCPSHQRGSWYGFNSGVKKDCVDLIPPGWVEIYRQ